MVVSEDKGSELHDADKPAQIVDFRIRVPPVKDSREVEEFGTVVDFRPESFLEKLLGLALSADFFYEVEVG